MPDTKNQQQTPSAKNIHNKRSLIEAYNNNNNNSNNVLSDYVNLHDPKMRIIISRVPMTSLTNHKSATEQRTHTLSLYLTHTRDHHVGNYREMREKS